MGTAGKSGRVTVAVPVQWLLLASLVPLVTQVSHENLLSPDISVFDYNDAQVRVLNKSREREEVRKPPSSSPIFCFKHSLTHIILPSKLSRKLQDP